MGRFEKEGIGACDLSFENGVGGSDDGFSGNARFDASQYVFFGSNAMEDVELGGLEDDDEDGSSSHGFIGIDGKDFELSYLEDRLELGSYNSEQNAVLLGDRVSFSRESSATVDWVQEPDSSIWLDDQISSDRDVQDHKTWLTQPHSLVAEPRPLHCASSYPLKQQQQQINCNESVIQNSYHTFLPGGFPLGSTSLSRGQSLSSPAAEQLMALSPPNMPSFLLSGPSAGPHGLHYDRNMTQVHPSGRLVIDRQQNDWFDKTDLSGNYPNPPPNMIPRNHINGLMPSQVSRQHRQQGMLQMQPPSSHWSHLQPQLLSNHASATPLMMNRLDPIIGMGDLRDHRLRPRFDEGQDLQFPQQFYDRGNQINYNGWPQFKSKYLTSREIDSIIRVQLAATHSKHPYLDDYYHQACLVKRSAGVRPRHDFCPSFIKDLPDKGQCKNEQHAYLNVDALGRLSFSSARRPRPLLEVETFSKKPEDGIFEQESPVKSLEQEPLLAARVTIEDALCLLLDVDDINRILEVSQPHEVRSELKKRREVLLEALAASLQLADPFGQGKSGNFELTPETDLVFLHIISLPKGRKLLTRYLQLLTNDHKLSLVVCMAIFHHLRFLFSEVPSDGSAAETTANLAKTVAFSVLGMDLDSLSACLGALVCSSEQLSLRPLDTPAGDRGSVIVKSLLERATDLLTNFQIASSYSSSNRTLWQSSFDAFFTLLSKYCVDKYDSVMQPVLVQAHIPIFGVEAARALGKEIPVELLRACLPHTNENQRKLLLDFAQKTVPVTGY